MLKSFTIWMSVTICSTMLMNGTWVLSRIFLPILKWRIPKMGNTLWARHISWRALLPSTRLWQWKAIGEPSGSTRFHLKLSTLFGELLTAAYPRRQPLCYSSIIVFHYGKPNSFINMLFRNPHHQMECNGTRIILSSMKWCLNFLISSKTDNELFFYNELQKLKSPELKDPSKLICSK